MVIFQTMGGTFSIVPGEGSQGEEAISLAEALAVPLPWDPPSPARFPASTCSVPEIVLCKLSPA